MGFMSSQFPGQSRILIPYYSKIASLFVQTDGEPNLVQNTPPAIRAHSISLTTFCLTTSLYFSAFIIPVIHQPNTLEVEIDPKDFLLRMFNTLGDDDPL